MGEEVVKFAKGTRLSDRWKATTRLIWAAPRPPVSPSQTCALRNRRVRPPSILPLSVSRPTPLLAAPHLVVVSSLQPLVWDRREEEEKKEENRECGFDYQIKRNTKWVIPLAMVNLLERTSS